MPVGSSESRGPPRPPTARKSLAPRVIVAVVVVVVVVVVARPYRARTIGSPYSKRGARVLSLSIPSTPAAEAAYLLRMQCRPVHWLADTGWYFSGPKRDGRRNSQSKERETERATRTTRTARHLFVLLVNRPQVRHADPTRFRVHVHRVNTPWWREYSTCGVVTRWGDNVLFRCQRGNDAAFSEGESDESEMVKLRVRASLFHRYSRVNCRKPDVDLDVIYYFHRDWRSSRHWGLIRFETTRSNASK